MIQKPLRVCLLTDTYYPLIGGGEIHARDLCRYLRAQGVDVMVLTRRLQAGYPAEELVDETRVTRLPPMGMKRLGKYLFAWPTYWELLRRAKDYDVLLVCSFRVAGIPALLAARRLGKPCVLRAESRGELSGDFIWQSPDSAIRGMGLSSLVRGYLKLRNRLLLKAQAFIAISTEISGEFRAAGVAEERNHRIFNGVDTDRFSPPHAGEAGALRRQLGLPDTSPLLMYSGKLNRGKGLECLLRAWAMHVNKGGPGHLVLVGGGAGQYLSCEEFLRKFVMDNQLSSSVTFAGYQARVEDYLRAADGFLFASENEALGLSLIEAMACGLPVLSSDSGGMVDIVENGLNGRLVPTGRDELWAAAIQDLACNYIALRTTWGVAARETAVRKFSFNESARKHLQLLQDLVNKG